MSFQKCSKEAGFPPALTDSQLGWLTTRPWQDVPIMVGYFKRTAAPPSQRPFYAMPMHIMYLLYKSRRFVCRKHSLWLVQDNCWIIMVISQTATGRILSQRGIKKKKKDSLSSSYSSIWTWLPVFCDTGQKNVPLKQPTHEWKVSWVPTQGFGWRDAQERGL